MRDAERLSAERKSWTASQQVACIPHDTTPQPDHICVYVKIAGNLVVKDRDNVTISYPVQVGRFDLQCYIITTATDADVVLWS